MPASTTYNPNMINPLTGRRFPLTPLTNICPTYVDNDLRARFPAPNHFNFRTGILRFVWQDIELQATQFGKQHDIFLTLKACVNLVKEMSRRAHVLDQDHARHRRILDTAWVDAWRYLNRRIKDAMLVRLANDDPSDEAEFYSQFNRIVLLNDLDSRHVTLFDHTVPNDGRGRDNIDFDELRSVTPGPDSPNYDSDKFGDEETPENPAAPATPEGQTNGNNGNGSAAPPPTPNIN